MKITDLTYSVQTIDGVKYDACETDAPILVCYNCHHSAETLYPVPEFNFMGCDACLDDALAEIERDPAIAVVLPEAA